MSSDDGATADGQTVDTSPPMPPKEGECEHMLAVAPRAIPDSPVCEQCVTIGSDWKHLRMCLTCGQIGCCDESPLKHATGHFRETSHPVIRSAEPGEDWRWCFVDEMVAWTGGNP